MTKKELEIQLDESKVLLEEVIKRFVVFYEILSRIVEQNRTITFDSSSPIPEGDLKWESGETEAGSVQTTIWFIPKEATVTAEIVVATGGRE